MLRTHTCGELRKGDVGKKVMLAGWIDTLRVHGSVAFIDLRDRYGKVQIVFIKKNPDFAKLKDLLQESCIQIAGEVVARKKGTENSDLATGDIEVFGDKIEIFSKAPPLPFQLDEAGVNEDLRLKYRYLDLRREKIRDNIIARHKIINFIRTYLDKGEFVDISTPILTKSTPEGARDFIVPSRIHPGKFYALPQSPQQYKQLLMIAGFDRYYQISPCFRDEDARADRSPGEFYQLDVEMSFVEQDDILDSMEKLFIDLVKEQFPEKKITKVPFPRLSYDEVMKKYGTDSPDLRKDKEDPNELAFVWIIDFPLFEGEKKAGHYAPSHHMFTMPKEGDWKLLTEKDAGKAKSYQHDLVLNGFELGGGSIRIHLPDIQEKIFDLIGFSSTQKKYFEHMLTAFKYGVPPHGGVAFGIDRLAMLLLNEPNIREVIAFPKNQEAKDVTMDAPSEIDSSQLRDVHIKLDLPKKATKKAVKKAKKK